MKLKALLYITLLSLTISNVQAQKAQVAAADKKYDRYSYIDAIKTYERVAAKGYKSVDMFQRLGNAYYFNAELEKAEKWYGELFGMSSEETSKVDPEYYYRYSQCLKSVGQYDKADKMLAQFNAKSGNDERAKLYSKNKNYLEVIKANSGRYNIEDAGINSKFSDYGSSFSGNQLVFASARDTGGVGQRKFKWNNQSFTNLYSAEVKTDGSLDKPEKFSKKLNSKFHESTPIFTRDGNTMYFTRNNYNDGKKGKDSDKTTLLKLYRSVKENDQWSKVTELPFNSNQYSVAHPALSPDDKILYFASDMPGTLGQSDIFKVNINSDGSYTTPENLGNIINTQGKETFPFITNENELYYATDGHPGLGGLDVFVAKIEKDGKIGESQNVGAPINGKTDDFAMIIDNQTRTGFFTSNREGGKGFDDIYKFTETKKLTCEQELSGIVTDQQDGSLLPKTQVILLDSKFKEIGQFISDEKAHYQFTVLCGETYYVRAIKADYDTKEQKITIDKKTGKTDLPIQLEKRVKPVKVGDDLAKVFKIKMIYFDLDKSFIRPDAALELEKILDVMKENPAMKIDIRSHTDSRQTNQYNESLSDRRAKSTQAWLIKNGIQASRLTAKGYGETQLVNKCADGVECTEAEHQANRRSEFIIVAN
jgi:outer membrane protein OmpA-like peptidoglycan-associated protein/tetratricopeptide (TPR) repeat protein